jgi:hypothetical protein
MDVIGQLHAPAALPPRKETPNTMDRRLREPEGGSWCGGEEKENFFAPAGNRTPVVQPVAYSLYWLNYPGTRQ